ncbi:NAD(P)/FAD-dependent oxidoreductase [Paenibacillus silvisoli]|uniref:NAD(P)/FAD-dependent oxidoreductase n=1 Tax=Paenibacillus silvisoli TaxID=3110539 RepID=UPI0028058BBF|nr:NAD(P)/FAD-dependent oxidoreductase [Paenibacillus silvisoli]
MMDCIIVGGGIAGLQAAIQLGRYAIHNVLVIDAGDGRSAICRSYKNLLGFPEGVSGETLRKAGLSQLAAYGIEIVTDTILEARSLPEGGFELHGGNGRAYRAKTLLIATGVMDRLPDYPELRPCLGLTVFVCPDCDGYEIRGRRTLVLGAGDAGARMALTLRTWTDQLIYVDQADEPRRTAGPDLLNQLAAASIAYRQEPALQRVDADCDGNFRGVTLQDGTVIEADRAFVAYGGNEVKSSLAKQLGAKLHENSHIWNDPRSKMTSVPGVWAAGDVAVHSEQVSIAMGEGAQAAIWIHKTLLDMRRA